mmetsp:Transcript_4370/g.10693  ORF Transcript_4370/g.10693 Transcript_4370/m.10693 type:complete len:90 (-) Transcript_4370:738-1007(-)
MLLELEWYYRHHDPASHWLWAVITFPTIIVITAIVLIVYCCTRPAYVPAETEVIYVQQPAAPVVYTQAAPGPTVVVTAGEDDEDSEFDV